MLIPIYIDIYLTWIFLSIGQTDTQLSKALIKAGIAKEEVDAIIIPACKQQGKYHTGRCVPFQNGNVIVRVYGNANTPSGKSIMIHELFHAATMVLDARGIPMKMDGTDEAYAYLLGHLSLIAFENIA